jgi:hypothetical protein
MALKPNEACIIRGLLFKEGDPQKVTAVRGGAIDKRYFEQGFLPAAHIKALGRFQSKTNFTKYRARLQRRGLIETKKVTSQDAKGRKPVISLYRLKQTEEAFEALHDMIRQADIKKMLADKEPTEADFKKLPKDRPLTDAELDSIKLPPSHIKNDPIILELYNSKYYAIMKEKFGTDLFKAAREQTERKLIDIRNQELTKLEKIEKVLKRIRQK